MRTRSILIVDDDPNFRKTLTDILTSKGYAPVATDTGAAALDQVKQVRPAVALIDLRLEDMSGLKLMQQIKTHSPGTECIVLTGYASQASAIKAVNLGAYGYLQKPYDMEQLLVTIQRAVETWETQETLEKLQHHNKLLLDAAGEGILGLDLEGRHTFVNPAAATMLGYTVEELIGQDSHSTWHHSRPHDKPYPKDKCPIHSGTPNQPIYGDDNEVFWHKNGTSFPVEYVSTPIQEKGQNVGTVVVFRDIAERQQREQEIEQRNRELTGLLKISKQLTGQYTLQNLLTTVTDTIVNTLPTGEAASLWLVNNEQQNALNIRAWSGHAGQNIAGLTVPIDNSLVGLVFGSRELKFISDATTEPIIEFSDSLILKNVRSTLGVPLLVDDQPIGVLLVNSFSRPQAFGPNEIRWLQSLAGQAAIMIQNEQLYEQVRSGHERLEILSRQLLEVQETERRFLAQELHDEIGQALTIVKINLQMMQQSLDTGNPTYLEKGINTVDHAIQHVRNLSLDLRPSLLDDLGLVPTLRWYVDRQAQETGIDIQFTATSLDGRPPPDLEIACFRLVQEALTNVIRHAQAQHVEIELHQSDHELQLTIQDNGIGFDVQTVLERAAHGASLGLLGMQERVQFAGGHIKINSTPSQGTDIQVCLPVPSPEIDNKQQKEVDL